MSVPREGESLYGPRARADYVIDHETGCWEWQKSKMRGYPNGRQHRRYYERAYGEIPPEHDIHHKCHNRGCVNPEHLEAVHRRDHDIEHFLNRRGITFDMIRAIREEGRKPGANLMEVAKRYGVGSATVQQYWANNRWEDILDDGPVGRPAQVCHLPGCDVLAVGKRRDKRYCCPEHARADYQRRKREERKAA